MRIFPATQIHSPNVDVLKLHCIHWLPPLIIIIVVDINLEKVRRRQQTLHMDYALLLLSNVNI